MRQTSQKIDDASPDTNEQLEGQAFDHCARRHEWQRAAVQVGRDRPRPAPMLLEKYIHEKPGTEEQARQAPWRHSGVRG